MNTAWTLAKFVTNFGDAATLLSMSAGVFFLLIIFKDYRVAFTFLLTDVCSCLVMAILKITLRTCGSVWTDNSLISPSGHTAFSTTVYGALAGLAASRSQDLLFRVAIAVAALLLACSVAASRVLLGAHNIPEVVVGFLVGLLFSGLFWVFVFCVQPSRTPLIGVALIAIVLIVVLQDIHVNIEAFLEAFAKHIRGATGFCVRQGVALS